VSSDLGASGLAPEILSWAARALGGEVTACERVTGGASRLSYILSFAPPARVGEAFLRVDSGSGPLSGTIFTLAREVAVMTALQGSAVRVPQIHAFDPVLRAVLMQKVPGTANFFSVTDPARGAALQRDLLEQLELLHRAPVDLRAVFGAATPTTVRQALRDDIAFWSELYRRHVSQPEPILTFALDWLHRYALGGDGTPVLIHGDIGPGNFLFEEDRVSALIDWELTHAGHPLEDLACIIARTLGVPFGDLRRHVLTAGELAGKRVDAHELDYCIVLVLTRWCIAMSMGLARASVALDVPILVKFLQVNLFAIARLLARLSGVSMPELPAEVAPPSAPDLHGWVGAVLEQQIRPVVAEPFLQARLSGAQSVLAWLRNLASYGTDRLRAEELDGLRVVVGEDLSSVEAGRAALGAALRSSTGEQRAAVLRWLLERLALQQVLMKDTLGPMFERKLDYRVEDVT
jgi:aminoglycoside phosphotransferase (APT) family kinase protein